MVGRGAPNNCIHTWKQAPQPTPSMKREATPAARWPPLMSSAKDSYLHAPANSISISHNKLVLYDHSIWPEIEDNNK